VRVGGRKSGEYSDQSDDDKSQDELLEEPDDGKPKPKIFSQKRKECRVTSRLGDLATQKLPIPDKSHQIVKFENCDNNLANSDSNGQMVSAGPTN
jgi:hypothetical protein